MILSKKTCRWIMETVFNYVLFLGSHLRRQRIDLAEISRHCEWNLGPGIASSPTKVTESQSCMDGNVLQGVLLLVILWGKQCSLSHSSRVTSAQVSFLPPHNSSTPWPSPWLHKLMSSPLRVWIGWLLEFLCVIFRWFKGEHLFLCWFYFLFVSLVN